MPLLIAAFVAGCSKAPTIIDGSNPEQFEQTTEKARRDLPIKDRLTFDAALRNPGGQRYATRILKAVAREAYHGHDRVRRCRGCKAAASNRDGE